MQDSGSLLLGSNARLRQSQLHTGSEREEEGIQQWALRWLKKDKGGDTRQWHENSLRGHFHQYTLALQQRNQPKQGHIAIVPNSRAPDVSHGETWKNLQNGQPLSNICIHIPRGISFPFCLGKAEGPTPLNSHQPIKMISLLQVGLWFINSWCI